jgi:hypothetical protein
MLLMYIQLETSLWQQVSQALPVTWSCELIRKRKKKLLHNGNLYPLVQFLSELLNGFRLSRVLKGFHYRVTKFRVLKSNNTLR